MGAVYALVRLSGLTGIKFPNTTGGLHSLTW